MFSCSKEKNEPTNYVVLIVGQSNTHAGIGYDLELENLKNYYEQLIQNCIKKERLLSRYIDLDEPELILSEIAKDYVALEKPVGPADLGRIRGLIGKSSGSDYGQKYAGFKTKIDQATIFLTQAISGAQVSDQERERIKELIPQVGDTERVFEAKLESLEKYLGAAQNISEETGGDITSAIEILEKNGGVAQFVDFSAPIKYIVTDDVVDLTQN